MLGYACLNETIKTSYRTCKAKTLDRDGLMKVKRMALENLMTVLKTLKWNELHDIRFFRMSSGIVPLATHKEMYWNWKDDKQFNELCEEIKDFVVKYKHRLTVHPGQYCVLNSPNNEVVKTTLEDLEYHAHLLEKTGGTDMVLHTGGVYGEKEMAMKAWYVRYKQLPDIIKKYLRLENDDKSYTINDVLSISKECGVPIILDIHHHNCKNDGTDLQDVIDEVFATWKGVGKPKVHISTGRLGKTDISHHDYVSKEDYDALLDVIKGYDVDIMVEAKKKEKAVLQLMGY